jgi:hypothetical protein
MSHILPVLSLSGQENSTPPSSAASQKVFDTAELLEAILVHLQLPDLLRVNTVCKQWFSVIKGSSQLQQALFLHPAKDETAWLVDVVNLPSQIHPLRRDYKSSLRVKAAVSTTSEEYKDHHGLIATPVQLNPLFLHLSPEEMKSNIDAQVDSTTEVEFSISRMHLRKLRYHAAMDMFLTQPPVRQVCVESTRGEHDRAGAIYHLLANHGGYVPEDAASQIYHKEGVRLKHVHDAVLRLGGDSLGIGLVRLFLSGGVVPADEDEKVVAERTEEWRHTMKRSHKRSRRLS